MFSSVKLRHLLWLIVHIDADTHFKKPAKEIPHTRDMEKGLKLYVSINGRINDVQWVEYCI